MIDTLIGKSTVELSGILRSSVSEWNRLVVATRVVDPGWGAYLVGANLDGAYLVGANLDGAKLGGADLYGASLYGASLYGANLNMASLYGASLDGANLNMASLDRANLNMASLNMANLNRANLCGARLKGATIGEHTLTGRVVLLGEAANYPVLMFATESGHVLRAGCWTGQLDDAVKRATEENDTELVRLEAELVVAHGYGILDVWKAAEDES